MKRKENEFAAVVEIGSNEIKLKIGQRGKNKMKAIDSLMLPLSLGRDTFNNGKVSFDKVGKACEIIQNFTKAAADYGIPRERIRVISSAAVREALNKDYILDQIRLKTGLNVHVLDNSEEKFYIYKAVYAMLSKEAKQSALIIYIGSGNLGVSVVEKEHIPFVQTIKVGSMRLSELFDDVAEYSNEFHVIVEEYLESFTDMLEGFIPNGIGHFIAVGNEIGLIAELCGAEAEGGFLHIGRDRFREFYDGIKYKSVKVLMDGFRIAEDSAELLLPAVCICDNMLGFTDSARLSLPDVSLIDSYMYGILFTEEAEKLDKEFLKSAVLSAKAITERFGGNTEHSAIVESFALKIFDKIKKLHGLGQHERLLLQVSAIIHDIGKYINLKNHYRHSYNIISGLEVIGLNYDDIETVANISLYHSRLVPSMQDGNYRRLSETARVTVSKLTAILRLADSLDRGHNQKFGAIDVRIGDGELIITISSDRNTELEKWSFDEKCRFFEEVFGMKAILYKKKTDLPH